MLPTKLYFNFQLFSHHLFLLQQHLFRPQSFLKFHSDHHWRGGGRGAGGWKSQGHCDGQNLGLGDLDLSNAVRCPHIGHAGVEVASPPAMTSPGSGSEPICTILELFVFINTLQFAVHTLSTCGLSFAFANN